MSACGELVDEVLRRVRDPQGTANPRATVRNLLDRAQVLFVRATTTLIIETPVTAFADQLLYTIDPQQVLRILDIFNADRRLWPVRWPQMFNQLGPLWWRQVSTSGPTVWCPLSTIHYAIYPGFEADDTLTLRVQQRPATLDTDDVPMDIPNEFYPRVVDFTEALVLLRQRDPVLAAAVARVTGERAEPLTEEVA